MSQHIAPIRTYVTVYIILLILLAATVGVAQINLGDGNLMAALAIAGVKGMLIILIFMHVKDGPRLTWIFSAAAFIWLFILLTLTMMDFLTRYWVHIDGK